MKKIVVIQTAFLGDLLLAVPLLKQIRVLYPESEITLVCRKNIGEIFIQFKLCDKLIEIDKTNKEQLERDIKPLFTQEFDLLLCPHQSFRSHLLAKRIKAKLKVGFAEFWNFWIFQKRVTKDNKLPDALRQLSLLSALEPKVDFSRHEKIPDSQSMGIKRRILSHIQTQRINQKFRISPNSIFIAPGSVWNTKRWTEDGFRELTQKLSTNYHVVLIGSQEERELCNKISLGIANTTNIAGQTTIFELATLLTFAKLVVSNDSGAMHMASLAETPTVAIFGPTVLEQGYEPWNNLAVVVENKDLDCRPCGKHGHEKCPIGTHICMKSIAASTIIDNIEKMIRH